jgi:hypothetical protein
MAEMNVEAVQPSIEKHPHVVPYEQLAREVLQDSSLSFGARGLWAYMRSMPDGWRFNEKHLISVSPESRHALRSKLRELEAAGLLTRKRQQQFQAGTEWVIYHLPQHTRTGNQTDCKPVGQDSSRTEKQSDWKPAYIDKTQSIEKTQSLEKTHPPLVPPEGGEPKAKKWAPSVDDVPAPLHNFCDRVIAYWKHDKGGAKTQKAWNQLMTSLAQILAEGGSDALLEQFKLAHEAAVDGKKWASIRYSNWKRFGLQRLASSGTPERPKRVYQRISVENQNGF